MRAQEQTVFWRAPELGDLELLRASYHTHTFARHAHDGFAIGVIERGAEMFEYRRQWFVAPAGSVAVINPGEVHTGQALTPQGWSYRMLYPDAALLQQAAIEVGGRTHDVPFFPSPVLDDPPLAQLILQLHATMEQSSSPLEQQSRFVWTLAHLIARHAEPGLVYCPWERRTAPCSRCVRTSKRTMPTTCRLISLLPPLTLARFTWCACFAMK